LKKKVERADGAKVKTRALQKPKHAARAGNLVKEAAEIRMKDKVKGPSRTPLAGATRPSGGHIPSGTPE